MSLPDSWVDLLFERLTVRYGAAFVGQYKDVDPKLVKGDWSVALSGFSKDAIRYALEYLPADKAPNAMQFRDLCKKAPHIMPPALPAPKADEQKVQAALAKITEKPKRPSMAEECIANIEAAANRRLLTAGQRHVLAACLALRPQPAPKETA